MRTGTRRRAGCCCPNWTHTASARSASVRGRSSTPSPRRQATLMAAAVAGIASLGYAALVPHGWVWVGALNVPGLIRHPYDPATVLGWALHLVTILDLSTAMTVARTIALAAGAFAVLALTWRASRDDASCDDSALVGA